MSEHIEIEELLDDSGDYFGAYCMGHVDKSAFCLTYKNEFDNEIHADDVEHVLARKVPLMKGKFYEGWTLIEAAKPGRGVFKATIVRD